jgi:hypothetical protein
LRWEVVAIGEPSGFRVFGLFFRSQTNTSPRKTRGIWIASVARTGSWKDGEVLIEVPL